MKRFLYTIEIILMIALIGINIYLYVHIKMMEFAGNALWISLIANTADLVINIIILKRTCYERMMYCR